MLEALEAFGPAAYFRTSFLAYPLVNALHVLAIGALATSAILMDLRVLGLGRRVGLDTAIGVLRPVAAGALALAVLSGLTLFSVQPVEYVANPAFRLKLLLLFAALVNAAAFTTFRLHRKAGSPMVRGAAVLSITLWISVAVAGRFIGFLG